MKLMTKGIILGLGIVVGISAVSCSNSKTSTGDKSSLDTNIAQKWFSLGKAEGATFDTVYTTEVYDPSNDNEDYDKTQSYYTIYAPTDLDASIRLTLTEINSDAFSDGSTSVIRYLQTIAYSSTYQDGVIEHLKEKKDTISASITSLTANIQTSWEENISSYSLTSDNLSNDKTNYLAVYYMPLYIRTYESGSVETAGFVCVPVYASITSGSIGQDADGNATATVSDTLAQSFVSASKYVTYTYNSSSDKIE